MAAQNLCQPHVQTTKTTGRLSRTSSAASNKANTPLLSTPQGADPFLKEPGASTALPTSAATEALDTIPKVSVKRSSASSSEAPAPQSRRSSIDLPTPAPPLARHVEARQINQVPNPVEETRPPTAGEAAAVPLPAAVPLRLPVATPDSQVLGGVSKSHSQIQSPFEAKAHEKFADEQNLPPTSSDGGAFIHEAAGDGGQQGVMVSGGGEDEMQIGSDSEEQQEKQADGDGLAGDLHCSTSEMQEMAASGDSNENRGAHASNSAASAGRRVSVPSEGSSSSLQRIGIADGSRKIEGAAALHHELVEARELAKVIDTSGTSRSVARNTLRGSTWQAAGRCRLVWTGQKARRR